MDEAKRVRQVQRLYSDCRAGGDTSSSATSSRTGLEVTPIPAPDSTLVAFLQLVALKLNKQRALISLVDADHQYFLAEGTRTGDLIDPTIYEHAEDEQWMGCTGSTTRAEALCSNTIVADDVVGGYPSFVVTDLWSDGRFRSLPYVAKAPHYRYYAGTPLICRGNLRVGSLFVIDTRVGKPLTESEISFMGKMAANVMQHLELQADHRHQKRQALMLQSIATLVSGERDVATEPRNTVPETVNLEAVQRSLPGSNRHDDAGHGSHDQGCRSLDSSKTAPLQQRLAQVLFARAASIFGNALEADHAVFMDLGHRVETNLEGGSRYLLASSSQKPWKAYTSIEDDLLDEDFLKDLYRTYSTGTTWMFNADGSFDHEEHLVETQPLPLDVRRGSLAEPHWAQADVAARLRKAFPKARQIMFVALHSEHSKTYGVGCFAVSEKSSPVLCIDQLVPFARMFIYSLSVLLDQISNSVKHAQKDHFISSISHELRSPLHGIVATIELMSGTELSSPQLSMCETLETCAQTLLDTISQLLDFSKVNEFLNESSDERKPNVASEDRSALIRQGTMLHSGSSLYLNKECDIATICEEAVTVASIAHTRLTAQTQDRGEREGPGDLCDNYASDEQQQPVLVLSIAKHDWRFLCSPGAIRRIVLNLVGNSLKYTRSGSINVRLDLVQQSSLTDSTGKITPACQMLTLQIVDTGIGMSADFIANRLFVPFSQESSVAPGAGLGLSLVHGIVQSMNGEFNVKSTFGKGTDITIKIPLYDSQRHKHDSGIVQMVPDPSKTFHIVKAGIVANNSAQINLRQYMQSWFGFQEVHLSEKPDVIIIAADSLHHIESFLNSETTPPRHNRKLFMIHLTTVESLSRKSSFVKSGQRSTHHLAVPIGPLNLAKALQDVSALQTLPIAALCTVNTPPHFDKPSFMTSTTHSIDLSESDEAGDISPGSSSSASSIRATSMDYKCSEQDSGSDDQIEESTPLSPAEMKVLCVDDNGINLRLLETYSKKAGFTSITTASDGLQAFQAFERSEEGYRLIFMDLTMPVCDGFESTTRIRELEQQRQSDTSIAPRPAIIIAFTGLASKADQEKAFSAGVDHFVTKPLRYKAFEKLLRDCGVFDTDD